MFCFCFSDITFHSDNHYASSVARRSQVLRRVCDASGFAEGPSLEADPAAAAAGAVAMDHISATVVEINGNLMEPNEKTPVLVLEPSEIDITAN